MLTHPVELALIRKLLELPSIVEQSLDSLSPHPLAQRTHKELARQFHRTYEEVPALHSDVPEDLARARLKLCEAAKIVFAKVLDLMGMPAPEYMQIGAEKRCSGRPCLATDRCYCMATRNWIRAAILALQEPARVQLGADSKRSPGLTASCNPDFEAPDTASRSERTAS